MVSGFGSGLVGRVGGGVGVGIGLRVGNWQFSSNFLLAFANLLLGVVASISGSFFCFCFLGVGIWGWLWVGNPAGVGTGGVSFSLVFNWFLVLVFSGFISFGIGLNWGWECLWGWFWCWGWQWV